MKIPTPERLRELLSYDEGTGLFSHRIPRGKHGHIKPGSNVGSRHSGGYIVIDVDRTLHFAHRLAWLYVYGEYPKHDIDHVNGERSDNRIANLRAASRSENMQNLRHATKRSSSGLIGAYKCRARWVSRITLDGVNKYLGVFDSPEEAHACYMSAKAELHPFATVTVAPAASAPR